MTTSELRREIKKIVDQLPPERLASLADYVHFLGRPPLPQRIKAAEKAAAGKAKPASFKGHYIKTVTLSSSQSPSVRIASTEYGKY